MQFQGYWKASVAVDQQAGLCCSLQQHPDMGSFECGTCDGKRRPLSTDGRLFFVFLFFVFCTCLSAITFLSLFSFCPAQVLCHVQRFQEQGQPFHREGLEVAHALCSFSLF